MFQYLEQRRVAEQKRVAGRKSEQKQRWEGLEALEVGPEFGSLVPGEKAGSGRRWEPRNLHAGEVKTGGSLGFTRQPAWMDR